MFPNSVRYVESWKKTSSQTDNKTKEPPNLTDDGSAPDLPARPTTTKVATPPPATPAPDVSEQARILKQYEEQQAALKAQQDAEERARQEAQVAAQREFEQRQRDQAERERLAQDQLMQQQLAQYSTQAAQRVQELERELLGMRGQYERDQLLLEQYDRVRAFLLHKHPSDTRHSE